MLDTTLITADITARVSRGESWPLGGENAGPGNVLMCSAEDDAKDTIVPRLVAAGADLERVDLPDGVMEYTEDAAPQFRALALDKHLEQIGDFAKQKAGRLRLLIVDPVAAFLGTTAHSHKNSDVRSLIAGLARLASEHRYSVLVVSHLNKGAQAAAIYQISGSLAFIAAARAAFAVGAIPRMLHADWYSQ